MKAECSLLFEWLVSLFENKNKTKQQKKSENLNMYERNKLKKKHHQLVQKSALTVDVDWWGLLYFLADTKKECDDRIESYQSIWRI